MWLVQSLAVCQWWRQDLNIPLIQGTGISVERVSPPGQTDLKAAKAVGYLLLLVVLPRHHRRVYQTRARL